MHGVVIHEGSVTLQVELAQSENSQRNEGDSENQTQQGVRCTTTFCNTEIMDGGQSKTNRKVESAKRKINIKPISQCPTYTQFYSVSSFTLL